MAEMHTLRDRYSALPRGLRRGLAGLLAALAVLGAARYFRYDLNNVTGIGDWSDLTYYYLNSKYFDELGYTRLYEAMLIADSQRPARLRTIRRYRELRGYDLVPVERAYAQRASIERRFTPARWEAFAADVAQLTARPVDWAYFFKDHGYNPPPT
jgi:hypothetical protein